MLSPIPDNWIPNIHAIFPNYLSDLTIFVCPASPLAQPDAFASRFGARNQPSPDCVSSLFYTYTGFAIWCDEQAVAVFNARYDWSTLVTAPTLDLDTPVWPDSDRVNFASQRGTPVLWDRVPLFSDEFAHPAGVNVLHMDGHVEFVRYSPYNNSNFFPATRAAAETFGSVLPQLPSHCYSF